MTCKNKAVVDAPAMVKIFALFDKCNAFNFYLTMAPLVAWLWSFPMFGPLLSSRVLEARVDPAGLFLIFAAAHAAGLLFYVLFADYTRSTGGPKTKAIPPVCQLHLSALACGLLTVAFAFLPVPFWPLCLALTGLSSAPFMIWCGMALATKVEPEKRGRHLGIVLLLAVLLHLPFTIPVKTNQTATISLVVASMLPLISLRPAGRLYTKKTTQPASEPKLQVTKWYWPCFVFILLGFYAGGGLMYGLVYSQLLWTGAYTGVLATCFYLLAALPAGILADNRGRRFLLALALSSGGLGFLALVPSSSYLLQLASSGLLQAGFAAMDIFIWCTLADWTASNPPTTRYIGWGLSLNVAAITLSAWEIGFVTDLSSPGFPWPLAAAALLFALLPFANLLQETAPSHTRHTAIPPLAAAVETENNKGGSEEIPAAFANFFQAYRLTPRETQVAILLLSNKSLSAIQEELCISRNTLKTHLRNIYRKTGTTGQKEFILLAWEKTGRAQPPARPKPPPTEAKSPF